MMLNSPENALNPVLTVPLLSSAAQPAQESVTCATAAPPAPRNVSTLGTAPARDASVSVAFPMALVKPHTGEVASASQVERLHVSAVVFASVHTPMGASRTTVPGEGEGSTASMVASSGCGAAAALSRGG